MPSSKPVKQRARCPMESFIAICAFALAAAFLLVTGCHEPKRYTGMVCGKTFDAAYTDTTYIQTDYGTGVCQGSGVIIQTPIETEVPDKWSLSVSETPDACTGDWHDVEVSRGEYESAQVARTRITYDW